MPKNVGDLGKYIVAKGFKKLPKVQKIAQSGHTEMKPKCFSGEEQLQLHLDCSLRLNTIAVVGKRAKYLILNTS